jgi:hypothetical protein
MYRIVYVITVHGIAQQMHFRDDDTIDDDVYMKGRRGSIYVPYTSHQVWL